MQNIENLISALDSEVVAVLQAFDFPESYMAWSNECNQIFSDIYASAVRRTKDDIRAVARDFRGQLRVYRFHHHLEDLVGRNNMLRVMLCTVDLLTTDHTRITRLDPDERRRVRGSVPTIHCAVHNMTRRLSSWQDDIGAALAVFCLLEEPEATLEEVLASLPDTIPDAYVSQGKDLIDRLVGLWVERRVITVQAVGLLPESQALQQCVDRLVAQRDTQRSIIQSFRGSITRLIDIPSFHFAGMEFTARDLLDANTRYDVLFVRRRNMTEEMVYLETILDGVFDHVAAD